MEGLRRIVAPNASALTGEGTNTWVADLDRLAVVDPGPDDPRHLRAILAALGGRPLAAILLTHRHADHAALAPALARVTGAPVLAHGAGLEDGAEAGGLVALHTPGHAPDHLCFRAPGAILTGDHAMGWASTLVAPPEGDMGDYMASLDRLLALPSLPLLPGHGPPVADGHARLRALREHRRGREAALLAALAGGPLSAEGAVARVHGRLEGGLGRAAALSLLAHLLDLRARGVVAGEGDGVGDPFRLLRPLDAAPPRCYPPRRWSGVAQR